MAVLRMADIQVTVKFGKMFCFCRKGDCVTQTGKEVAALNEPEYSASQPLCRTKYHSRYYYLDGGDHPPILADIAAVIKRHARLKLRGAEATYADGGLKF